MASVVEINGFPVGDGHPVHLTAEIGINHNGDVERAKKLIDVAMIAGWDAVKFQKRNPDKCVPEDMKDRMRETPWGYISYLEYRRKIEFGRDEYNEINSYCKQRGIVWYASCWDEDSVELVEQFDVPCHKIASAMLTNERLLSAVKATGKPIILSTGMSTTDEIRRAVDFLGQKQLLIAHATSTYPCPPEELNLLMIPRLKNEFDCPIGFSGHDVGLSTTIAAVALGACFVERHVTLNRTMWGSDQAASVEPQGMFKLARDIRTITTALGDGVKRVYDSEMENRIRLRGN
ncbi:N-acetylneuraminate synthase family protein [Gemmatimonadota bacterium]